MKFIVAEPFDSVLNQIKDAWAAGKYAVVAHRWYAYKPICPVRELGRYLEKNIVYGKIIVSPNSAPCLTCSMVIAKKAGMMDELRIYWRSDKLPLDGPFLVQETGDIVYMEDLRVLPEDKTVIIRADKMV